jgi:hypothetical protein
VVERKVGGVEEVRDRKMGGDGLRPKGVEVEAYEEAFVCEAEEEEGARVVVIQPEDARDVRGDGFVRGGAGDEGAKGEFSDTAK